MDAIVRTRTRGDAELRCVAVAVSYRALEQLVSCASPVAEKRLREANQAHKSLRSMTSGGGH